MATDHDIPFTTMRLLPRIRPNTSSISRFNSVDLVEMTDISVATLYMVQSEGETAPIASLATEKAAPRVAKLEPSKSAASETPSLGALSASSDGIFRAPTISGMETGYVNLDGTTRSNVETPPELKGAQSQLFRVTFYCACMECCGKTNAITASGEKAIAGTTVAASSSIPFGTRIWIAGYGERIVQDRGGAIGLNRLDIYVNTHEEALSHGSRMLEVWFL